MKTAARSRRIPRVSWIGIAVIGLLAAGHVPAARGVTLQGTVVLQDYAADITAVPVTVDLQGGSPRTETVYPDLLGRFGLANVEPGTYDVWIKAPHWLARRQTGVAATGDTVISAPFVLTNGDGDGDNEIGDADLSIVLAAADVAAGDPGWNAQADLDGDGAITSTDLSIILSNMNQAGDAPLETDIDTLELTPLGNLTNATPARFGGSWDVSVPSGASLRVIGDPTNGGHGQVIEYLDGSLIGSLELYARMTQAANDCRVFSFDLYATATTDSFGPVVIGSGGTEMVRQTWYSDGRIDNCVDSQSTTLAGAGTFSSDAWYRVTLTVYPLAHAGSEYARYDIQVVREADGETVLDQKNIKGCRSVGTSENVLKFGFKPASVSSRAHLYLDNFRLASKGNIAYGKPCTFSPAPSYSTCTDSGDPWQLTDGLYTTASLLWNDVNAVGWERSTSGVTISLDLGQVESIRGVSFSAAASPVGASGVPWPSAVYVLAGTDNVSFYPIAELVRQTPGPLPDPGSYQRFRYCTEALRTKGRYIKIFLTAPGEFAFCDEIEIYRGKPWYINIPYAGLPTTTAALLADTDTRVRNGYHTRLKLDGYKVKQRIQDSPLTTAAKTSALAQIKDLLSQVDSSTLPDDPGTFKAIVPYDQTHAALFRLNAQVLAAKGYPALTVWHAHRYAKLSLFEEPNAEDPRTPGVLGVTLMANETRADVLNLTNAGQDNLTVQFQVQGLPGGVNPAYLSASQVEFVDTREGGVVAAALTPLSATGGFYQTVVPAGMTRQVWLSFNPDTSVSPGTYTGSIDLTCSALTQSYPFTFKLSGLVMPYQDRVYFDETFETTSLRPLTNSSPTHNGGAWEVVVPSGCTLSVINDPTGGGHGRVLKFWDTNTSDTLSVYARLDEAKNETLTWSYDFFCAAGSDVFSPMVRTEDTTQAILQAWYASNGRVINYSPPSPGYQTIGGSGTFVTNQWYHVVFTVRPVTHPGYAYYDIRVTRESDGAVVLDKRTLQGRYSLAAGKDYVRFGFDAVSSDSRPTLYLDNIRVAASGPDLDLFMWDYAVPPQYGLTLANRDAAIADMKSHGVTVSDTVDSQIPYPLASQLDAAGNLTGTPDFTNFDNYVATWPGARRYQMFASVTPTTTFPPGAGGKVRGTAAFTNAITQWSAAWAAHNRSIGLIGPGRILINWIDEPTTAEQYQTITDWAVPFKAGSANHWSFVDFTLYQDVANLSETARNCLNGVDVICPLVYWTGTANYAQLRTLFTDLQQQGKTTWFYRCAGPSRHFDPTAYYRLQPWHSWVQNMTGSAFWSYGSTHAATNWNEYASVGYPNYSPVYIDPTGVTSGRHWEAVREGLEDYQYLKMLKVKTDLLETMGTNPALVTEARDFLAAQPQAVINGVGVSYGVWPEASANHALLDQARLQAMDLMERMGF